MAINFPTSPALNDTHTDGTTTWKCVALGPPTVWDLVPVASSGAGGASLADIFLLGGM